MMNTHPFFYRIIFLFSLTLFLVIQQAVAQDELKVISEKWLHYQDAPNALYQHLAGQAYELLEKRKENISRINTLAGWQERQALLRETLLEIIGPFPEKTPLKARITRTIKKDDYKLEHIIFESQPQFYVTSSLYIPLGLKGKAPAIIYCSGHTNLGYRSATYQRVILNLVKKGFIVLAFDPVGQGERLEYYDPKNNNSSLGGTTKEHSYPGAQAIITGSSQARYMAWDGIRAVDYLLTRKEVDPARIGITGRSGGGTQSAYIAALDDRIYAAAPENYITNFTRLLQSIGPQDAEQNLFNGIAKGIDHPDLLAVRAPKPALMITTTGDIFSIQGARETKKEVSEIYTAYGKEEHFTMVEDDAGHASTQKNREAMYAFFQEFLNNPGDSKDKEVELLSEQELQVTATGQVSTSLGGATVFSLNRSEAEKLLRKRSSEADLSKEVSNLLALAKERSGYQEPSEVEEPVFTGRIQREGYVVEKYFLKGEGNYIIPYLLMIPEKSHKKSMIYLHPAGKAADASAGDEIEQYVKEGFTVLAPDLVGVGEMSSSMSGDSGFDGVSYNLWFASLLIGRSIAGIQAGDVNRLVRMLKEKNGSDEIYAVAQKEMAPVLLHAAAFNNHITHIALIEPYISYNSLVTEQMYRPQFIYSSVPGSLPAYDLPDLAANLAPRRLVISGITDGRGNIAEPADIEEEISLIKAAYQTMNAVGQLTILPATSGEIPNDLLMEWINK
ncbi:alpha/beta hydrolase family protein [soil metagenome]